ncbi:GNAT family N-acetyltransferase [Conexibacter sp. JD483]|uniref:GNAT family N-acetyltransferase n=1 Tax=unclassified Conexibacter TaxID=2627773 RepID=UPI0027160E7B|nr:MULTISPECIES: GNAT family N-acetyltransferase [unclassified Conexibacter]MDO8188382.1 GNAT family N-acetyltransferase [Conexibacter sp. CPCC 205706]MDO8201128.1 GNAT family N-acetyltransferase [Conexibacter sp. CPCC 205762]MDR9371572.1 GNAT family N-acetyltransferase [Conexibacter sp. JD483]
MLDTLTATMRAFNRIEAPASVGGSVVERDGLIAFVTPSAPTQSIVNCVMFEDHAALAGGLASLRELYADAGVSHWMVWTLPGDEQAPPLLEQAGHFREYEPMAMALDLSQLAEPAPGGTPFALDADPHPVEITILNERANGELPGAFGTAFAGLRDRRFKRWMARVDGRPAACLVTFDHDDNRMVQWVATDPGQQRRGLARQLLHAALADARERGLASSTLESSYEGERLYAGLGYRSLGRLGMWLWNGPPI